MDTSKEYIKMCDYPEIQEQWKPKEGDWVCPEDILHHQSGMLRTWGLDTKGKKWLPRQDQIQEMFKTVPFVLSGDFDKKMENYITGDPDNWSFEMLWLAFYVWEKHKKKWDGKKWVK